jgi:hypothetical protein
MYLLAPLYLYRKRVHISRAGNERDLHGAKQAVEALLLSFVDGRGAFIEYGEGGLVEHEAYERHALLFTQAEQVVPVVDGIKGVYAQNVTIMQSGKR